MRDSLEVVNEIRNPPGRMGSCGPGKPMMLLAEQPHVILERDRWELIAEAKALIVEAFEKNWVVQDLLDRLDRIGKRR